LSASATRRAKVTIFNAGGYSICAAKLAGVLADRVKAAPNGEATQPQMMRAATAELVTAFTAAR
jgi:hypothetical protein